MEVSWKSSNDVISIFFLLAGAMDRAVARMSPHQRYVGAGLGALASYLWYRGRPTPRTWYSRQWAGVMNNYNLRYFTSFFIIFFLARTL